MKLMERIHGSFVYSRRVERITALLAERLVPDASVLDVGCGDGLISSLIAERRPDIQISGIDVLVRPETRIPVTHFDGKTIPFPDSSYDAVIFVDVLHHAEDPQVLLREAARVSRRQVLVKDHVAENRLQHSILKYMDRIGNERFGVVLPFNYWSRRQWISGFDAAGLKLREFKQYLGLYPFWADFIFGRSLHCIADLEKLVP
jgi:ubiquinone/menaquinone biosynthesis C-methylase UbiE